MMQKNQTKKPVEKKISIDTYKEEYKRSLIVFDVVAIFSVINSMLAILGYKMAFVVGLGITQIFDALISPLFNSEAKINFSAMTVIISIMVAIIFLNLGDRARQGSKKAIKGGMFIYSLDALIFVIIGDWFNVFFHVFMLLQMLRALVINNQLRAISLSASLDPLSGASRKLPEPLVRILIFFADYGVSAVIKTLLFLVIYILFKDSALLVHPWYIERAIGILFYLIFFYVSVLLWSRSPGMYFFGKGTNVVKNKYNFKYRLIYGAQIIPIFWGFSKNKKTEIKIINIPVFTYTAQIFGIIVAIAIILCNLV